MINVPLLGSHRGVQAKSTCLPKKKHVDISRYSMERKSTVMGSGADLTFAQAGQIISLQVRLRYGKEFNGSDIPLFVVF